MPQTAALGHRLLAQWIQATKALDVDWALGLFAPEAMTDDPSTCHCFSGWEGIRCYIEQYFVAYQTVSCVLLIENVGPNRARARLDFSGGFGHEIGVLELSANARGLMVRVDAHPE